MKNWEDDKGNTEEELNAQQLTVLLCGTLF